MRVCVFSALARVQQQQHACVYVVIFCNWLSAAARCSCVNIGKSYMHDCYWKAMRFVFFAGCDRALSLSFPLWSAFSKSCVRVPSCRLPLGVVFIFLAAAGLDDSARRGALQIYFANGAPFREQCWKKLRSSLQIPSVALERATWGNQIDAGSRRVLFLLTVYPSAVVCHFCSSWLKFF